MTVKATVAKWTQAFFIIYERKREKTLALKIMLPSSKVGSVRHKRIIVIARKIKQSNGFNFE